MDLTDIKKLRLKAGMSQCELAKKAGVSQAHIAKIETGKVDPRFSTVKRILECLQEEEKDYCTKYMTPTIYHVDTEDTAAEAGRMMSEKAVSQLVVMHDEQIVGLITERDLLKFSGRLSEVSAREVMSDSPPVVSKTASSEVVKELLLEFPAVVVMDGNSSVGIITKSDMIESN